MAAIDRWRHYSHLLLLTLTGPNKEHKFGRRKLSGSLPDAALVRCHWLVLLRIDNQALRGTLPDAFQLLPQLVHLILKNTGVSGALPAALHSMSRLVLMDFFMASMEGTIPDELFKRIEHMNFWRNYLSGSIPEHCSPNLRILQLRVNRVRGTVPTFNKSSLKLLDLRRNELAGALPPEAVAKMTSLETLSMSVCNLNGMIPDSIASMSNMTFMDLSSNHFQSTLPDAFAMLTNLERLQVKKNHFGGRLPFGIFWSPRLRYFLAEGNHFEGTFPERLRAANAEIIFFREMPMEGTLPLVLSKCTALSVFSLTGASGGDGGAMSGPIPEGLARIKRQSANQLLQVSGQAFRGVVPRFTSTLRAVVLHQCQLQYLDTLKWSDDPILVAHGNHFSCNVPRMEMYGKRKPNFKVALVAIGNHFMKPRRLPPWMGEWERDPLFFTSRNSGRSVLVQFLTCLLTFIVVVGYSAGQAKILRAMLRAPRLLRHMGRSILVLAYQMSIQTLCVCILLPLFAQDSFEFYWCPGHMVMLSAALVESRLACLGLCLVWSGICWHALDHARRFGTFSMSFADLRRTALTVTVQAFLRWGVWLILLVFFAMPGVLYFAAKSAPLFTRSGNSRQVAPLLQIFAGVCQGLITTLVIPKVALCVAGRLPGNHTGDRTICEPGRMLQLGQLCLTWLFPSIVVFVLDGSCHGRWIDFWEPCIDPNSRNRFLAKQRIANTDDISKAITLLQRQDVCVARPGRNTHDCVRSVLEQMSTFMLNKMMVSVLLIPAGSYFRAASTKSGVVLAKTFIALELSVAFGTVLPLLTPLLSLAVYLRYLLAALAADAGKLEWSGAAGKRATSLEGLLIPAFYSVCLHYSLVSPDPLVAGLLVVAATVVGIRMVTLAIQGRRERRRLLH